MKKRQKNTNNHHAPHFSISIVSTLFQCGEKDVERKGVLSSYRNNISSIGNTRKKVSSNNSIIAQVGMVTVLTADTFERSKKKGGEREEGEDSVRKACRVGW